MDRNGAVILLTGVDKFNLKLIFADGAYHAHALHAFVNNHGACLFIIKKPRLHYWGDENTPPPILDEAKIKRQTLHKRWIVERTFAWFGNFRRLSKDYERKIQNSNFMMILTMIYLMVKRMSKLQRL